jgi:hypothetical protein
MSFEREKPLSEDEIHMIEVFAKSPAFATISRLFRMTRAIEVEMLLAEADPARMHEIRGKVKGIDLILNLPISYISVAEQLRARQEEKQKAEEARKPKRSPRFNTR